MAPLIKAFKGNKNFDCKVCVTAQHREMLDQVLELFEIRPDYDLDLMRPGQNLNEITSAILIHMKPVLEKFKPDILCMATQRQHLPSLATFYEQIDVDMLRRDCGLVILFPWPEEHRKLTGSIAYICPHRVIEKKSRE